MEDSLRHFHGVRYQLLAWVVMPNHVHVLFTPLGAPMWRIVDAWKGYTAKAANALLKRKGRFWQAGYWDTWMRDAGHELRTVRYVEDNPVKAGLVRVAREWSWSSARFRDGYGRLEIPAESQA